LCVGTSSVKDRPGEIPGGRRGNIRFEKPALCMYVENYKKSVIRPTQLMLHKLPKSNR